LCEVVPELVIGTGVAEVDTAVVVVVSPAVGRAGSVGIRTWGSAVDWIVEANASEIVRPGTSGTLEDAAASPIVGEGLGVGGVGNGAVCDAGAEIILAEVGGGTGVDTEHNGVGGSVVRPERGGVGGTKRHAKRSPSGIVTPS
jgi:hypothetical protein